MTASKVLAQATIHGMICHANDVVVVQIDNELQLGTIHAHVEIWWTSIDYCSFVDTSGQKPLSS